MVGALGTLALVLVALLPAASGHLAVVGAAPAALPSAATERLPSSTWTPSSTHWLRPGATTASTLATLPGAFSATRPAGLLNYSKFCDPNLAGSTFAGGDLNASINTTPANGTGAAPLTFSWSVVVHSGGLPPYGYQVLVYTAGVGGMVFNSTNATGNYSLTTPGVYGVDVEVTDSTCTQIGGLGFIFFAYGAPGPNALRLVPSVTSGPTPLHVSYHAIVGSSVPSNWTVEWYSLPSTPNSTYDNWTFFIPGTYSVYVALLEPGGRVYEQVAATVTVGGGLPYTVTVRATPGPYPVNVTWWVNVTNGSLPGVPANETELYVSAYWATGGWNTTTGFVLSQNLSSTTFTETHTGCGIGYNALIDPSGTCPLTLWINLDGTTAQMVDNGSLGFYAARYNLTAAGNVTSWVPSATFSVGPTNGSAPRNLSINLSMANGVAPYSYAWAIAGHGSGVNGSFLPGLHGDGSGWNGSTLRLVVPLNQTGYYFADFIVYDSKYQYATYAPPLLFAGSNVTVAAPLHLRSSESVVPAAANTTGATVQFRVNASGGVGPFTVQWAFGDGTFASSVLGVNVTHTYERSGTFVPTVTVTGADGSSSTSVLPTVTVPSPPPPSPSSGSGPWTPTPPSHGERLAPTPLATGSGAVSTRWVLSAESVGAAAAAAIGLIGAGAWLYRREIRRQGEDLVAPWSNVAASPGPPPNEGPPGA